MLGGAGMATRALPAPSLGSGARGSSGSSAAARREAMRRAIPSGMAASKMHATT